MNRGRALRALSHCFKGSLNDAPDWREVLTLANERLITAEVFAALCAAGRPSLPEAVESFLGEIQRRTHARNKALFKALERVGGLLNEVGVEPILIKGCATWIRGDGFALDRPRLTSDIDLLAPAESIEGSIDQLLKRGGYRIIEDQRHSEHAVVVLGRGHEAGAIDLHLRPPGWAGRLGVESLFSASRPVRCGNAIVRAPPPHFLLLILTTHDQIHDKRLWRGGFDLRHLLDICQMTLSNAIDWEALASLARQGNLEQALGAQLWAARDIVGAQIPDTALTNPWGFWHYKRQRFQFNAPSINQTARRLRLNTVLRTWLRYGRT